MVAVIVVAVVVALVVCVGGAITAVVVLADEDDDPRASSAGGATAETAQPAEPSQAAPGGPALDCRVVADPGGKAAGRPDFSRAARTGTATMTITTNQGELTVAMDRAKAPCTVASLEHLAGKRFYDNSPCHRLTAEGIFVLQCGDPTGTGSGGPDYRFTDENLAGARYTRGVVAMANAGPDVRSGVGRMVHHRYGGTSMGRLEPVTDQGALDALRQAVLVSPDNLPLRRHLAEQLLRAGLVLDAEVEYRAALTLAPGDAELATGLAEAFLRQGKSGAALAALERVAVGEGPPRTGLVMAKALVAQGDVPAGRPRYWEAVARDPTLADPDFEARLGHSPAAPAEPVLTQAAEALAEVPPEGTGRSRVSFADVAGMEEVKQSLRMKLLLPTRQPELFAAYGKRAGGGVMLYGPPGCGKTHLARATAGELGAGFISVALSDILDMYIGSSERNLHATFEVARRHRPCVLFFDEVDALAARRADMRQAHNRQIVNQFLAEMDGVEAGANEGVLVLAATNAPWYVDAAFRRAGRFDHMVFVPPPDRAARATVLSLLCREVPLADLDFRAVAEATEGFTGADLKGVVDRAVEAKLAEAIRAGRPLPLSTDDLLRAARSVRPTAVAEWMATARNYVMYSNESGVWDDVLPWIGGKRR